MAGMWKSLTQGWKEVFAGAGYVSPPQPGNRANAPADPSVQTGNYQYIIPQMLDGGGSAITDIPVIPPFGVDWQQMPLNQYGLSGLEGGGSTGHVPNVNQGAVFYFDTNTGQYVDLALIPGVQV